MSFSHGEVTTLRKCMTRRMQPKQPRKRAEGGLSDERFVASLAGMMISLATA